MPYSSYLQHDGVSRLSTAVSPHTRAVQRVEDLWRPDVDIEGVAHSVPSVADAYRYLQSIPPAHIDRMLVSGTDGYGRHGRGFQVPNVARPSRRALSSLQISSPLGCPAAEGNRHSMHAALTH